MKLHRTVISLGIVSLLTDFSGEMIYPLLPLFLTQVLHSSVLSLGAIEGAAETTAALFKFFSGYWADRMGRRKPLVLGGYTLSSLARPLVAITQSWTQVLGIRFLDRMGKGIRNSPRDSLIAAVTPPESRGRAYGFHQSMDHAGAVLGPLTASLLLFTGVSLRNIFWVSSIPALICILMIFFGVREPESSIRKPAAIPPFFSILKDFSPDFRRYLFLMLLFSFGNASDAFILLRLNVAGIPNGWIAALWGLHSAVKMISSYYGGIMSDRLRPQKILLSGWVVYGVIYFLFAFAESKEVLITLFLLYGIYYGLTEPTEKAMVTELVAPEVRGTAFGVFYLSVAMAALPSSLIFGWIWQQAGFKPAFLFGALLALLASLLMMGLNYKPRSESVSV